MLFVKDQYGIQWNIRPSQSKKVLYFIVFLFSLFKICYSWWSVGIIKWQPGRIMWVNLKWKGAEHSTFRKLKSLQPNCLNLSDFKLEIFDLALEFSLKFQRLKKYKYSKIWVCDKCQVPLSVISSEPPRKDDNARFRTVSLKALSDQVILVSMFIISKFETGYFLFWFLY